MKTTSLIVACFVAVTFATTALALTVEREVTSSYVRVHPEEFAVSATKGKEGLINFTVTHHVATPMYHVAHLSIYRRGTLIARSGTPLFGKKRDNTFHFSIAVEDIAGSKFSLSDSALGGSGDDAVPIPGTIIYKFMLSDFVPKE